MKAIGMTPERLAATVVSKSEIHARTPGDPPEHVPVPHTTRLLAAEIREMGERSLPWRVLRDFERFRAQRGLR